MSYAEFIFLVVAFFVSIPVVCIYFLVKTVRRHKWNAGEGERAAKAEHARLKRERPELQDAQLTEAEFVHKFVSAGPGRYVAR